jgi:hypothetical protein
MKREWSDEILEEAPLQVAKLLLGLGALPRARALLAQAGLSPADVAEGRELVLRCLAEPDAPEVPIDPPEDRQTREAVEALGQEARRVFPRLAAALRRADPGVHTYLFGDHGAGRGTYPVMAWARLLGRLDVLEHGTDPARQAFRDPDRAAVALLARRGLDAAARQRYAGLVAVVLSPGLSIPASRPVDDRRERLAAAKQWLDEWSTIAHTAIQNRNDLIRLGLAVRRRTRTASRRSRARAKPSSP